MPRRVTKADKAVIRRMIEEEGATLQEVGEALGDGDDSLSKQTIWYHVKKMKLKRPEDEEHNALCERAEALLKQQPDMAIKALSDELGVSWQRAKSIMQELGYYEPPVPFVERVNAQRLMHLYVVEDKSLAELSEIFSEVSEMTISKALKELGVPMRPQGASSGDLRDDWRKEAIVSLGLEGAE